MESNKSSAGLPDLITQAFLLAQQLQLATAKHLLYFNFMIIAPDTVTTMEELSILFVREMNLRAGVGEPPGHTRLTAFTISGDCPLFPNKELMKSGWTQTLRPGGYWDIIAPKQSEVVEPPPLSSVSPLSSAAAAAPQQSENK